MKKYTIIIDLGKTTKTIKTYNKMSAYTYAKVESVPAWVSNTQVYYNNELVAEYRQGERV